jgi:hypothetical protein
MVMKRFLVVAVIVAGSLVVGACEKPSTDDCRAAISNMERLLGTDTTNIRTAENESEVRRCKGGSTREAVACAKDASTLAQLKACDFMAKSAKK